LELRPAHPLAHQPAVRQVDAAHIAAPAKGQVFDRAVPVPGLVHPCAPGFDDRHEDAGGRATGGARDRYDRTSSALLEPHAIRRMTLTRDGEYSWLNNGEYDTKDGPRFAEWIETLRQAKNKRILENLLGALQRYATKFYDHEAIARSRVKLALDRLASPPVPPAADQSPRLTNLPRSDWWKLFIEGEKQTKASPVENALRFDAENSPGYYAAMSEAFETFVARSSGARLGFADYNAMHQAVTKHSLRKVAGDFEPVPHELSGRSVEFPMTQGEFPNPRALAELHQAGVLGLGPVMASSLPGVLGLAPAARNTVVGLRDYAGRRHDAGNPLRTSFRAQESAVQAAALSPEQHEQMLGAQAEKSMPLVVAQIFQNQDGPQPYLSTLDYKNVQATGEQQLFVSTNQDRDQAPRLIHNLFDAYYNEVREIGNAPGPERRKLLAVARLVRALHVGHFFRDANGRLNTMLLLNRLLVDAGFSPVIMQRTEIFGGSFTADQLANSIEEGMRRFGNEVTAAQPPVVTHPGPLPEPARPSGNKNGEPRARTNPLVLGWPDFSKHPGAS